MQHDISHTFFCRFTLADIGKNADIVVDLTAVVFHCADTQTLGVTFIIFSSTDHFTLPASGLVNAAPCVIMVERVIHQTKM